jgi:xanthine dehydrogenase YagS FAD-binding subunit
MNSFEWIDADSVEEASKLLAEGAVAKAGGIDLLDLMKEGIVRPTRVVNLRTIGGLDEIRIEADGSLRLGALATLARIAGDAQVRARFGALASAAAHAATPQRRRPATARINITRSSTPIARPSFTRRRRRQRCSRTTRRFRSALREASAVFRFASFFSRPMRRARATSCCETMRSSRTSPSLPRPRTRSRRITSKQSATATTGRSAMWPSCCPCKRIALGWVAPVPRRATSAESLLIGKTIDESLAREAARAVVSAARPLSRNAYKVDVLGAAIQRTIEAAVG